MSTTTIEATFYNKDTAQFFDPTSVVLSDPTGTFGVKRDDTDAVVVADGTAMTSSSTGKYSYSFTDPALDLNYTAYIEYVYAGETYRIEKAVVGTATQSSGMTLETAREIATLMVSRLPGGEIAAGSDNLKRIDYAIKAAGDEFVRRTRCTLTTNDTLTLTVEDEDFSTATLTDFDPSHVVKIEIQDPNTNTIYPAQQLNYHYVRTKRLHGSDNSNYYPYSNDAVATGVPDIFAWRDANNAIVAPLPGLAYKVLLTYWEEFTSWTIGTASPADVTLNIPTELIYPVLQYGFRAYFHASEDPALAARNMQLFEKHIFESRGSRAVSRVAIPNERDYR